MMPWGSFGRETEKQEYIMLAAVGFVPVAPGEGRSEEECYVFSLSLVPLETFDLLSVCNIFKN